MNRKKTTTEHGRLLMSIIHAATADVGDRPSNKLNIRQRLVVQRLGLDGPTNPSVLGQRLAIAPSSITVLADRLEALGLLERVAEIGDRRATLLRLTPDGEGAFAAEIAFYQSLISETLASMGDDAAEKVLGALEALEPAAPSGRHP